MKKYTLSAYMGSADKVATMKGISKDEVVAPFDLLKTDGRSFRFGIDDVKKQFHKLKLRPTEIGFDLLLLAISVQAADTRLSREQTSQDGWCREIKIILPVSDVKVWYSAKDNLEKMLRFLTGDRWTIQFRERIKLFKKIFKNEYSVKPKFNGITLFSGGLDSLIGAIDFLQIGMLPLFISHAGEAAVSKPQTIVFDKLISAFKSLGNLERIRLPSGKFPTDLFPGIKSENTTRGRSFLFIALGCFAGSALKNPFDMRVPENGLIALNVPLDQTRLGASSTRTAHPYYMHRWNELLVSLKIPGRTVNPYWNKTKGDMVAECKNQSLLKTLVKDTVSCAHPSSDRWHHGNKLHCGYCVPCIIRRAALHSAWDSKSDKTEYRLSKNLVDSTKAEGEHIRAFHFAIDRIKKTPSLAKVLIFKPGPLTEDLDKVKQYSKLYIRGMEEVAELLKNVKTYSSEY